MNSAPYHPASNGQAERGVQSFKVAMKKTTDGSILERLRRFLFQYRITPHATTGVSPAELLHGRKPKSLLDLVRPDLERRIQTKQWSQKEGHDRKAKLREFREYDGVYIKNFRRGPSWVPAIVLERLGPRSYVCELESGRIIKAHVDHIRWRAAAWTPPSITHSPVSGSREESSTAVTPPEWSPPAQLAGSTETSVRTEETSLEGRDESAEPVGECLEEPQISTSSVSSAANSPTSDQTPESTVLRRSSRQRKPKIPYDV